MDAVGLSILERELTADHAVLLDTSSKARQRLLERAPGYAEACASSRFGDGRGRPLIFPSNFQRLLSRCAAAELIEESTRCVTGTGDAHGAKPRLGRPRSRAKRSQPRGSAGSSRAPSTLLLFRPRDAGERLARQVAREQGLPEDWINSDVAQFLADREEKRPYPRGEEFGEGLIVSVPTAAYLLALKLRAARPPLPGFPGDEADIRFLVERMRPSSRTEVESVFARFFPHNVLGERALEIIETHLAGID